MRSFLTKLTMALLIICMIAGLAGMILLIGWIMPRIALFFVKEGKSSAYTYIAGALAVLFIFGAEYIAITLLRMLRSVNEDPFVPANVLALKHMGVTALTMTCLGLATMLLHPMPLIVLGSIPVGMCGLFSLVLSSVFARAVAFKQENDLTV